MTAAVQPTPTGSAAANLICMASMLVWAAGLPAADYLIPHVPPVPLAALRLALAAAVLLPVWWMLEGGHTVRSADWLRGIAVGGICLGAGSILLIFAQSRTDAVTVAVISAMSPVVGISLETLSGARRFTGRLFIGMALSIAGGLGAYATAMGNLALGLGALAAMGSVIAYTWGSRASVTAFPTLTPLGRTAITVTGAAVVAGAIALILWLAGGPAPDWAALGPTEAIAFLIYGLGSIAISQVLWILSVGHLGIGVASLHVNAAPFYVMIFLWLLGGSFNWAQVFWAALVGLGVMVAQDLIGRRT